MYIWLKAFSLVLKVEYFYSSFVVPERRDVVTDTGIETDKETQIEGGMEGGRGGRMRAT